MNLNIHIEYIPGICILFALCFLCVCVCVCFFFVTSNSGNAILTL